MKTKKTVLLIDDHPVLRAGIKTTIEDEGSFEVVGEAGTASQGLMLAQKLCPDVAIVDLTLPDKNGIQLTKDIINSVQNTNIMILSVHSKIDYVIKSVKAGAKGYVIKESASECIIKCLKHISQGRQFIDHSLSDQLCELMNGIEIPVNDTDSDRYGTLTGREQEVLRLFAEGHQPKIIAEKLCISLKTVATHKNNIMKKIGVNTVTDMIKYAANIGIIDFDQWKEGLVLG
ncbi:Two component system response regulator, LuxR domain-containing [Desulfonema limicola]|uniref:Two component system response regulator, LuxR domain-containing n=1 Tax=Desulfonema limicola TaxID=45656 RepID=A0A975B4A6_9BACT|nr:response regulator transcription factor [Desulfonema limicola]QTA78518.1 Two component system response regulator, LuxR domain-containing [Desulfonema limicola]